MLEQAENKLVVIEFYASWCGPCKMVAPFFEKMAEDYINTVVFLKVDVDENEEVSKDFGISCMPLFIFMKNKIKIDEFAGTNLDCLKELIEKYK